MKEVKFKNYIILGIILIVSVILVFLINNFLVSTKNSCESKSIMSEMLNEIKTTDIDNFILENPNFIIYMTSKETCSNVKFEKNFKNFLIENDLVTEFIFINLDDVEQKTYINFIKKYYSGTNMPSLNNSIIVIENKKVRDVLNGNKFKINEVKKFLKDNEVY